MNAIRYTVVAAATAVGLLVAHAPSAHAEQYGDVSFLNDLYAHGWYSRGGDSSLLANGYRVCRMLNTATGDVVAQSVYRNTPVSVTRADAMEFVILAVKDLCPWHDHRGQGQAA
jgi:hypothetical protein